MIQYLDRFLDDLFSALVLLLIFLVILVLSRIAFAIIRKAFPSMKNLILQMTISGFLFSVLVCALALLLWMFRRDAFDGIMSFFLLFGVPTSLFGGILLFVDNKPDNTTAMLVLLACMFINTTFIGLIIGCIRCLIKPKEDSKQIEE